LYIPENPDFKTRNQLVIKGLLFNTDTVFVIVNHWPSRVGGEKRSAPMRAAAAQRCRATVDSILAINADAQIFIMGDFNDTPTNSSILKILKAAPSIEEAKETNLFNPYYVLQEKKVWAPMPIMMFWESFLELLMVPFPCSRYSRGVTPTLFLKKERKYSIGAEVQFVSNLFYGIIWFPPTTPWLFSILIPESSEKENSLNIP